MACAIWLRRRSATQPGPARARGDPRGRAAARRRRQRLAQSARGWRLQVALGLQAAFGFNVLTHLAQTIVFRDYSPGTEPPACCWSAPVTIYLYRRAALDGYLTPAQLKLSAALGSLSKLPGILLLQAAGRLLASE